MPIDAIIMQIATALSITSIDVYILVVAIVVCGILAILGIARIYNIYFGIVLGIGIFVLISTLLSPQYQTPETLSIISATLAKMMIGSSMYLIFILAILVPTSGGVSVTLPKTPLGKIFQTFLISVYLVVFFVAVVLWLIESNYIFMSTESAFSSLRSTAFYANLQGWSRIFVFLSAHIPTIIIFGVGFIIYKFLFADIVNAIVISAIASIKKWRQGGGWWEAHAPEGAHEEEHGGHEEHHGH